VTGPRGRYEPGIVTKARDGVESPMRPVLGGRGGIRPRGGMIAVAIIAITVVAAGIGLAGSGLEELDGASGSPGSPASGTTGPDGSSSLVVGCVAVDPADVPEFRLASTTVGQVDVLHGQGSSEPVEGVARTADGSPSPDESSSTSSWPEPGVESTLELKAASLLLAVPVGDACVRRAVAEYVPDGVTSAPVIEFGDYSLDPPRKRVTLGRIPAGGWILRVVVDYSTDGTTDGPTAPIERFFKVHAVHDQSVLPEVTPAVPCSTPEPGAALPELSLVAGSDAPVRGVDTATYPGDVLRNGATVEGAFPDRFVILVDGEACATSWVIRWLDYETGGEVSEFSQENADQNPYRVSQNRIDLSGGVVGQTVLTAKLTFDGGRTEEAAWEVTISAPAPPIATIHGPGGDPTEGVLACGTSWSDGSDVGAYEACPEWTVPDGVGLITLRSGELLTVDVPGWTIQGWNVSCGTRGGPNLSDFVSAGGCDLGGGNAGPMLALPFDGEWLVLAYVGVLRDGVSISASYFFDVVVGP
jgi:hypothetical protein